MNQDDIALDRMSRDFAEVVAGKKFLELLEQAPSVWRERPTCFHVWLARKLAHLTQAQLAQLTGLPQSLISRVERGRDVRISTMKRMYEAMGYRMLILPLKMPSQAYSAPALEIREESGEGGG
jgi:hypothetical protein